MLTIFRKDGTAWGPNWASDESSTYTATGTSTGAPPPISMVTGFVLAARATAMTMSATESQLSGPSTVPWPVPCSCRWTPWQPRWPARSTVSPAAVTVDLAECMSMSLSMVA